MTNHHKTITITWLTDEHDWESCGSSYAEGAFVALPDGRELAMTPQASCFGSDSYDSADVYKAILEAFGYDFVEDFSV